MTERHDEDIIGRLAATSGPVELPDVLYTGTQPPQGSAGVITVSELAGDQIGQVTHRPKHSPTGMAWGYGGSGPADCARSLLAHAIGDRLALCAVCGGHSTVVYHDATACPAQPGTPGAQTCPFCDHGLFLPSQIYQEFKRVFVVAFGDTFVITRKAIVAWLRTRYPGHVWPTIID